MKKYFAMKKKIFILVFSLFTAVLLSFTFSDDDDFLLIKNLEIYSNIVKKLRIYYVDDINIEALISSSINSMLATLDPFTNYFSESQIQESRFLTKGTYLGIGVVLDSIKGYFYVSEIIANSPAEKSGLKIGDKILKISGKDVSGFDYAQIHELITGEANTAVNLVVERAGKKIDLEINRQVLKMPSVAFSGIRDSIGYIKFDIFNENSGNIFKKKVLSLKKQGIKALIIDLRDNPGGLLDEAVKIANVFLPKNLIIVESKGKNPESNEIFKTKSKPVDTKLPIVILVNENSASASEIVSGSIQDYDRGVIIGKQTFGKGLVQRFFDVGYNSQVKITVARYYIPSGRCIQAIDYQQDINYKNIADSLLRTFKTKNGRTVIESKGIIPDIVLNEPSETGFVKFLEENKVFFLFAIDYYYSHPDLFKSVDELDFQDKQAFLDFLAKNKFVYEPQEALLIDSLKEILKEEKKFEAVKKLDDLNRLIVKDLSFYVNRDFQAIKFNVENWLAKLYFGQEGYYEYFLHNFYGIDTAVSILNDKKRYAKILNIK